MTLREFLEGRKKIHEADLTKGYYTNEEKTEIRGRIRELDSMLFMIAPEILDKNLFKRGRK